MYLLPLNIVYDNFYSISIKYSVIQNSSPEYSFDHLVIIARDKLQWLSGIFTEKGFQVTPIAHHNLGSINQLIMLDSTYIELLGWEPDKPTLRAEIANQAMGLDALVFRTNNAEKTYEQLIKKGFCVNPVQDLSREAEFMGKKVLVQFKTVRFSQQPIPGIRIYFCEHLTPEYVWQDQWLIHTNQFNRLARITIACSNINRDAKILSQLLNLDAQNIAITGESAHLTLPNLALNLQNISKLNEAKILSAQVCKATLDPVDFIIDNNLIQNP